MELNLLFKAIHEVISTDLFMVCKLGSFCCMQKQPVVLLFPETVKALQSYTHGVN